MAKFKKPILLQEEFAAGEISNPTTPAVKTTVDTVGTEQVAANKSGEQVRAEIVQDVDTILTNLEQLSKQITESVLNESLETLLKGIMSKVAVAQGEGYLKKYLPLLQGANQNLIDARIFKAAQPVEDKLAEVMKKKAAASGEAKKPLIAQAEKLRQQKQKIDGQKEAIKAKADAAIEKLKVKMTKAEGQMAGALKERYDRMKAKVTADVNLEGLKAKAAIAAAKGNKEAAEKVADEMQELQDRQDEIAQAIKDGESQTKEDLAELNGIKPFMAEVAAFADANGKADAVRQEISDASGMYESLKEGLDYLTLMLNEDIMALYTGAKKDGNVADISKAKTLAAKLKAVEAEVYKAKKALYTKVAAATVTNKSIIDLAGGDPKKAGGKEGEWKMGELKAKWGGAEGFISPEDYAPIKNAQEIEDNADKAIEDAELKKQQGEPKEKTSQQLADEFIAGNEGFAVVTDKDATVGVTNAETGEEEQKPKYEGAKDFTGKKEDGSDDDVVTVAKEIDYSDDNSANTGGGTDINEGIHAKIKKAMKAVEDGETVYGENVRFPGRFKIVSFNKDGSMANVDYEDGTDAFDMAAMNIAIDKLQFEAVEVEETEEVEEGNEFGAARAEAIAKGEKTFKVGDEEYPVEDVSKDDKENAKEFVEEAKEELPKKIKLYEGMSVADKFKALM